MPKKQAPVQETPKTFEQLAQEVSKALQVAIDAVEYLVIERQEFSEHVMSVAGLSWKEAEQGLQEVVKALHRRENTACIALKALEDASKACWEASPDGDVFANAIGDLADVVLERLHHKIGSTW